MSQAYPLHWPKEWPRNKNFGTSRFDTSLSKALKNVNKSIDMFSKDSGKKVDNIVISSNVTLGVQRPKDPGVAIYFSWDGITTCIAVDRYQKVEDNLQAIHHCMEAERIKLRHGGINLVRAAFRGYAALPPPNGDEKNWWDVLGCKQDSSKFVIEKQHKRLRSDSHPDHGGNTEWFNDVKVAYKQAMDAIS